MRKAVVAGSLLALLAAPLLYRAFHETPAPQSVTVRCDDLARGCRVQLASGLVEVRFSEAPDALKAFQLLVSAPWASRIYAGFAMVGMDMGLNRYRFHPDRKRPVARPGHPADVRNRSPRLGNDAYLGPGQRADTVFCGEVRDGEAGILPGLRLELTEAKGKT